MSVRTGQTITVDFTTRTTAGAGSNADSTPTGTLVLNGTDNGATVTVTNKATGIYKASVTLPTLAIGDVVQVRIAATVGGVTDNAVIWQDGCDLAIDTSGHVVLQDASIAAAKIANGALNGKGDWLLSSGYTAPDNAGIAGIKAKTDQLTFAGGYLEANVQKVLDSTDAAAGLQLLGLDYDTTGLGYAKAALVAASGNALAAATASAVWDEAVASHATAGSTGAAIGAARAVTDKLDTMLVLDGAVYQFTANALELGPSGGGGGSTTVLVAPLQSTVDVEQYTTAGGSVQNLSIAQNASTQFEFAITDGDGAEVDLTGKTVRLVVYTEAGTVLFTRETGGSGITISSNQVSCLVSETQSAQTAGTYLYALWNVTDRDVLAAGQFRIKLTPITAS